MFRFTFLYIVDGNFINMALIFVFFLFLLQQQTKAA